MSLSFNSISESAIGELPSARPVADLEVELFGENSFAFNLPTDSAPLTLSYANDEVALTFYGGNPGSWIIPLNISDSDTVQNIYNFVEISELTISGSSLNSTSHSISEIASLETACLESISNRFEIPLDTVTLESSITSIENLIYSIKDSPILSIDGDYFHNLKLFSNENGILSLEVIEKQFIDDVPNEDWRTRAGLPIGPISFNTLGIEQAEGFVAKSFSDISEFSLEINSELVISTTLVADDLGNLVLQDTSIESQIYNYVNSGNLTTISISDQVIFLNSDETLNLEISVEDQVQQIFEYIEVATLNLETTLITSTSLNSYDSINNQLASEPKFSIVMFYVDELSKTIETASLESKLSNYVENLSLTTESNDLISIRYYSFSSANAIIDAKTFAKEYTFLQQEYADDTISLSISAESGEQFRSSGGLARAKQIWIG